MTKNYLSIGEAAMKSKLSKIQIWMLIRSGIIRARYLDSQTKINIDELDYLIDSNIYKSYQLSLPLEYRESDFSTRECLRELQKCEKFSTFLENIDNNEAKKEEKL
ncbi:MAG: hypothetical protein R3Y50_03100 [Rikenellaceae bacterium]